ncbi:hypothetical protein PPERSA_08372 [Pseudocohnilembus persalinus]|uniref:Uncharacterized protein n=1 Tax=Pseudocohnilembus persalinus TaxID=266149 RepID=A0A0V0R667_PSEPJ|nr:hypothetical protein PPERSA_08372 [Pseudocohnilembus persalinus]|eukprot:KRX09971.1 hypothetical protein PPERSA_08372 [Pseudocohnilembus persalinus]
MIDENLPQVAQNQFIKGVIFALQIKEKPEQMVQGSWSRWMGVQIMKRSGKMPKSAPNFMEKNGIKLLDWMPKGTEISPIENIWCYNKEQIRFIGDMQRILVFEKNAKINGWIDSVYMKVKSLNNLG